MFGGRKANMGITIFLGVLFFNVVMFFVVYAANADAAFSSVGDGGDFSGRVNGTTNEDISSTKISHWYDGFNVTVFDLPWWVNIFYVTLQAILLSLSVYAMIRGLN